MLNISLIPDKPTGFYLPVWPLISTLNTEEKEEEEEEEEEEKKRGRSRGLAQSADRKRRCGFGGRL
jgi:hypothetical protein